MLGLKSLCVAPPIMSESIAQMQFIVAFVSDREPFRAFDDADTLVLHVCHRFATTP